MDPCIVTTNAYKGRALELVKETLPDGFRLVVPESADRTAFLSLVNKADYLLAGGRMSIDAEVLAHAPRLRMIQRTGVGLDSLDLEAIRASGLPVYVNKGVNARSVAEHTIMLMLAVLRRLPEADSSIKSGRWLKHELGMQCGDLYGKTVGLIGVGSIGTHVAKMLAPFGVTLVYNKPHRLSADVERDLGAVWSDIDTLFAISDIISVHCPLNDETGGILNTSAFHRMKRGVILINTSRGRIIDEDAMIAAMEEGIVRGVGLDVFPIEPPPASSRLYTMHNVVLSPHIAGVTLDAFNLMMRDAIASILHFNNGAFTEIEANRLVL